MWQYNNILNFCECIGWLAKTNGAVREAIVSILIVYKLYVLLDDFGSIISERL